MSRYDGVQGGEESALWSGAVTDLRTLKDVHGTGENMAKQIQRLKKNLASLEEEEKVVDTVSRLERNSKDYIEALETETRLLDQVRENLGVLIALRRATESGLGGGDDTRRKKRKHIETDTASDVGSRSKKARNPQEQLGPGSAVAFRQPRTKLSEGDWIQCNIIKITGEGPKARVEIQDPEPDENGLPGQTYKTTLQHLIPIATESAGLPPYSRGAHVLARYPETTTFYKAEVSRTRGDFCLLKFEGEEEAGKETEVERRLVLELAKHLT
ncbi:SGF29 tudor-like domain-domain-containing protein [Protomyces lactucae-debilis]|uniref:SGF29 tudor-like domain-domain-containing protein n=1 Tax=Protomyces lactucae-debilis TaxID=2754530 RepID=A0A1Y2EQ86_PROLT|nr:SGF29 tudor-like domain-containing protein [Protomyces lactucae-debilis]ORY73697.1 SGF29 tudor-like domain-domain-containing protein [Protomyces lactucae-debilis]